MFRPTSRPRLRASAVLGTLVLLALLAVGSSTSLTAQELVTGTWTGTIEAPGEMAFDVEFMVEGGEAPAITMSAQGQSVDFEEIELEDGTLHFAFNVGAYVVCALESGDDGIYEGECVGDDGESGILTMIPPDGQR